ncbi:unnamed protein product [Gongylonema pulchrum]|uniref:Neuromedin-B n=1 Tax=Gongylonema pulchrum TaxID=637853 RepID=A0A183DPZ6_9BILA|nr:unnamed protein product [Gongylonema pulchrum]
MVTGAVRLLAAALLILSASAQQYRRFGPLNPQTGWYTGFPILLAAESHEFQEPINREMLSPLVPIILNQTRKNHSRPTFLGRLPKLLIKRKPRSQVFKPDLRESSAATLDELQERSNFVRFMLDLAYEFPELNTLYITVYRIHSETSSARNLIGPRRTSAPSVGPGCGCACAKRTKSRTGSTTVRAEVFRSTVRLSYGQLKNMNWRANLHLVSCLPDMLTTAVPPVNLGYGGVFAKWAYWPNFQRAGFGRRIGRRPEVSRGTVRSSYGRPKNTSWRAKLHLNYCLGALATAALSVHPGYGNGHKPSRFGHRMGRIFRGRGSAVELIEDPEFPEAARFGRRTVGRRIRICARWSPPDDVVYLAYLLRCVCVAVVHLRGWVWPAGFRVDLGQLFSSAGSYAMRVFVWAGFSKGAVRPSYVSPACRAGSATARAEFCKGVARPLYCSKTRSFQKQEGSAVVRSAEEYEFARAEGTVRPPNCSRTRSFQKQHGSAVVRLAEEYGLARKSLPDDIVYLICLLRCIFGGPPPLLGVARWVSGRFGSLFNSERSAIVRAEVFKGVVRPLNRSKARSFQKQQGSIVVRSAEEYGLARESPPDDVVYLVPKAAEESEKAATAEEESKKAAAAAKDHGCAPANGSEKRKTAETAKECKKATAATAKERG